MNELAIKEIQIIPVKFQGGLVAFASVVINNLYISNISIYSCPSSPDGFRLVYPTKTLKNGIKLSILHPIDKETGLTIQKQIVEEYLKLVNDLMKGDTNDQESGVA